MVVAWTGMGAWSKVSGFEICFEDRIDMSLDGLHMCSERNMCDRLLPFCFVLFSTTGA